ncbi:GNAT family N-acetyltransferase [Achromobacter xylosoxidans]|uniref:GNAT family N-acetyltransferase n=1 Tax=Alcaligenes xylosoxydans xylosoxydans TaxID=85698 RepID=UPI0015C67183|nr:GNAT family N-acetyltransferase [Achromobacter xylosoxidans]
MIEPGKPSDIEGLVELGRAMAAESPRWSRLAYSADRVRNTITNLLSTAEGLVLVARRDGRLVGGILAIAAPNWMSEELIAQEVALFMLPQYRGTFTAARLVCAMAAWSKAKGARWVEAGVSTGVHTERTAGLYRRLGFHPYMIGLELEHGN